MARRVKPSIRVFFDTEEDWLRIKFKRLVALLDKSMTARMFDLIKLDVEVGEELEHPIDLAEAKHLILKNSDQHYSPSNSENDEGKDLCYEFLRKLCAGEKIEDYEIIITAGEAKIDPICLKKIRDRMSNGNVHQ